MKEIKQKGITLIALVITIIILIILAGITISTLTGESGLLNNAKKAETQTKIESIKEQIKIDILSEQTQNGGNISDDSLENILLNYGTLSKEEKIIDRTLTTTKEKYKIKISDIFNGTTVKDVPKNPTLTTVANAPDISGFNKSNTYYVSWDLTSSPYQINEDTNLNGIAPSNWYDYTQGVNHWANLKTTGGGNDCYWVWIPRYAYKIPSKSSSINNNSAQKIEIKFLEGTSNVPIGETETINNTTPTPGTWVVHPAFTNAKNGGFGELTGIWVAKYQASSSSVGTINLENGELIGDVGSLSDVGGGQNTSLNIRIKPNVTSWRGINVNGIFEVCRNLTSTEAKNSSLVGTSGLDSHMMKNIEWGAVAYLSSSKYGKIDESGNIVRVFNNPYYSDDCSPITGLSGKTATQKNEGTTDNLYTYNTTQGSEASTTGNVYGVYDMAGGAWEYTAAIFKSAQSNNNISILLDDKNKKYVDQYTTNTDKYGDAVYETSVVGDSEEGSWDGTYASFPSSENPMFNRGGRVPFGEKNGIFAYGSFKGMAERNFSFRPVLVYSSN